MIVLLGLSAPAGHPIKRASPGDPVPEAGMGLGRGRSLSGNLTGARGFGSGRWGVAPAVVPGQAGGRGGEPTAGALLSRPARRAAGVAAWGPGERRAQAARVPER